MPQRRNARTTIGPVLAVASAAGSKVDKKKGDRSRRKATISRTDLREREKGKLTEQTGAEVPGRKKTEGGKRRETGVSTGSSTCSKKREERKRGY